MFIEQLCKYADVTRSFINSLHVRRTLNQLNFSLQVTRSTKSTIDVFLVSWPEQCIWRQLTTDRKTTCHLLIAIIQPTVSISDMHNNVLLAASEVIILRREYETEKKHLFILSIKFISDKVSIVKITKRIERIKTTRPMKLTHRITLKSHTYRPTNKPGNNIVITHGILLFVK